jgi:hypothetical protein
MARKTPKTPADPGDWTHNLADFDTEAEYLAALEEWQTARDAASPLERDAADRARIAAELDAYLADADPGGDWTDDGSGDS